MRILAIACVLVPLAAAAQAPPTDAGAPPPKPTATPLTLFVQPGRADLKVLVGQINPQLQQNVKLWTDHVVQVMLRQGFTVVDNPKKPHDAEVKLAIAVDTTQHAANITLTVENDGKIVDVIEEVQRKQWNSEPAVGQLIGRLNHSGRMVVFGQQHHAPPKADQAKAHHEAATHKFDLGQFDDAVKEWSQAYELDAKPEFLYNIGNAYRRKGEIEGSVADLKRAQHFYRRFSENDKSVDVKDAMHAIDVLLKKLDKK
jgi:tetratricopeptide (TPR) repeat protein